MKFVITGANSFIGWRLVRRLKTNGHQVILVVRNHSPLLEGIPGIKTMYSSLKEYNNLGELVGPCDCFVHLAWNGTRGASRMDTALQQSNLECSLAAVRSVLSAGCKRIVTAGSQAEYGPQTVQITEDSPCIPNTEYGKAKLAFYKQASALCAATDAMCIEPRFFSLYGPGDFSGTMVISILNDMLANRPCKLTQGLQMWDFLYIEDAVNALLRLCTEPCSGGVYNFGSGDVRQLRAYVEEMATVTGTKSELLFGAVPYPATGMVSLWPDVSKLKRELNWEPQVTFEQGIRAIQKTLLCEEII